MTEPECEHHFLAVAAGRPADEAGPSDGVELGGDAACWAPRVCPDCGLFVPHEPPTRCPRCGAMVGVD